MTSKPHALAQLFSEHNGKVSDKWSIYISEYDRLFQSYRNQPVRLLEIGIQNGGSLEIWGKYFTHAIKLIGCDINQDCAQLQFDDPRITVVVADANTDETQQRILKLSPRFDLIIDDGSHRSGDIVRSFARYFTHLDDGGLYIAEDLHCSYWQDFDGGLYQPYSSIAFFKQLADTINHEHWGIDKTRTELLRNFNQQYETRLDEVSLAHIHSIEFINSMCVVRKAIPTENMLGQRFISGTVAQVDQAPLPLHGHNNTQPNQNRNHWATKMPIEEELTARTQELACLNQMVSERDKQINSLIKTILKLDEKAFQKIFDAEWYVDKYPDINPAEIDPYQHYVTYGIFEGRVPSADLIQFIRKGLLDHLNELHVQHDQATLLTEAQRFQLANHEKEYSERIQAVNEELDRLHIDNVTREQIHKNVIDALRNELTAQLRMQVQREQEIATQLLTIQQQADQELAEQARKHIEQEQALLHQHAGKEKTHKQQIIDLNRHHADREQEINKELLAKQAELYQLTQNWLSAEQIQIQTLNLLQHQLNVIRSTYSWRWTAPFRQLARLLIKKNSFEDLDSTSLFSQTKISLPKNDLPPNKAMYLDTFHNKQSNEQSASDPLSESNPAKITGRIEMLQNLPNTKASTLDELLSYYDESFIHSAYHTVLGRAPDAEGLRYYLCRLRSGISKISILEQLRLSREAKNQKEKPAGLDDLIRINRRKQWPFIGLFFSIKEQNNKLNVLENELYLIQHNFSQQFNVLLASLKKPEDELKEEFFKKVDQNYTILPNDYENILQSGFFDREYYLKTYPDIALAGIDPLLHYFSDGWKEYRNPSPKFDTNFYITKYKDIKESGKNPLLHFLEFGKNEGRSPLPSHIVYDLKNTLNQLTKVPNIVSFESYKPIDIIIPIYNGYDYLEPLFSSIIKNSSMPFRLIVINDCSPDNRINNFLQIFCKANTKIEIVIINNTYNLGFIKSVNKGVLHTQNHFVLLNTDTEVPPYWLERLMSPIFKMDNIASTTPFTNSGTICSFPNYLEDNKIFENLSVGVLDHYFQYINVEKTNIEIPTGIGFCMGVNKKLVDKIGMFDEIYGKGYGEENDWCQRAINSGYKNLHITNLFVYHKHGGSFASDEKKQLIETNSKILKNRFPTYFLQVAKCVEKNELQNLRAFLKGLILSDTYNSILIFDHSLGGGTNEYRKEKYITNEIIAVIAYYPIENKYILTFEGSKHGDATSFQFIEIETINLLTDIVNFKKIEINNLVSYPDVFSLLSTIEKICLSHSRIKLEILIHDHYFICPMYTLLDSEKKYCGIPSDLNICNKCLKSNTLIDSQVGYLRKDYPVLDIKSWRSKFSILLTKADNIITFSNNSKEMLQKTFPTLRNAAVIVRPHTVDWVRPVMSFNYRNELCIAIIGNLSFHKGINVIKSLAFFIDSNNLPIKFHIFGNYPSDDDKNDYKCLVKHGQYQKSKLPELMEKNRIEMIFVPSIWPETFSYTTEEAIKMKITVAVFNLGAPAERILKYEKGIILNSFDNKEILEIFWNTCKKNERLWTSKQEIFIYQIYYEQNQKQSLSKNFIPYFNPKTEESKIWHENEVFFKEYLAGNIPDKGLHGFLSWRFNEKTQISDSDFIDFIEANPGYDVYFVNPFPELADLYSNVWEQGDRYHVGIKTLVERLFKRVGYNIDLNTIKNDTSTLLYCNYWVGNKKFWDAYMNFLLPIYNLIKKMPAEELATYTLNAGYHTGTGYITFLMERLFSTFLTQSIDIKFKPYIYDKLHIALLISNLRKQVGM